MSVWDPQFLLNGELRESATLAELEAMQIGDGVFTTLACYDGKPFLLDRHWERLCGNARTIGIGEPKMPDLDVLLEANSRQDAKLKICALRGGDVWALSGPLPPPQPTVKLRTTDYCINERSPLAGVKSMSYGAYRAIHPKGSRSGVEVLVANTQGNLCEGTYSNVFVVMRDEVWTPPLSSGCLPGVTRERVMEQCRQSKIPVHEKSINFEELRLAAEVFISSSLLGVQLGNSLDGEPMLRGPNLGRTIRHELISSD